jgi:nucleoside-diphosphate-sugar epimerase
MKRVIVTGATGFVGANLARRLLREGHEVHLLVRPGYQPWRIEGIRNEVRLYELHLDDLEAVGRVVSQIRPEWVFHLAAHGAYASQTDLQQMVKTNLHGTMNLVAACLKTGFEAFVNTGSSSEYGFKDHPPAETEMLEPNSYYAVTKASATLFCRYAAQRHRVHMPTLRLYSVYGPYEEPTRLVPTVIVLGLEGRWPPLVNPAIARDYVYVDDAVNAHLLVASKPQEEFGAIYNVGTGVQTTLREVAATAAKLLSISTEPQWGTMANRVWDTSIWVADNRKICRHLGWNAQLTFAEGLAATINWFRDDPAVMYNYRERLRLMAEV